MLNFHLDSIIQIQILPTIQLSYLLVAWFILIWCKIMNLVPKSLIKQFQAFQTSSSDAIIQKRGMRRYVLNYYQKSNTLSLFSTIKMWQNDKICFLIILTWHPKKDQNFNCAFEDDKWRIFPNAFNPFISSDWQIDFYELHSFW